MIGASVAIASAVAATAAQAAPVSLTYSLPLQGVQRQGAFNDTAAFSGTVLIDEKAGVQTALPVTNVSLFFDGNLLAITPGTVTASTYLNPSFGGLSNGYAGDTVLRISGLTSAGDFLASFIVASPASDLGNTFRPGRFELSVNGNFYSLREFVGRVDVAAAVPEVSTWAMMLIGFGAIGAATRVTRRRFTFEIATV